MHKNAAELKMLTRASFHLKLNKTHIFLLLNAEKELWIIFDERIKRSN